MKLLIVAGEHSGDLHASSLVREILRSEPSARITGLGGPLMRGAGVELYEDIVSLAVVGLWEAIREYGRFRKIFHACAGRMRQEKPDAVVLVDFPGFNMRFAEEAKRQNIPVIYYITPQVWAWGGRRVEKMKRLVDLALVVFKFEEEIYSKAGIDVRFVGHPLLDILKPETEADKFRKALGIAESKTVVALLPGSRENEARRLLPVMYGSARIISRHLPGTVFVLPKAASLGEDVLDEIPRPRGLDLRVLNGNVRECMRISSLGIIASGTATLEAAIASLPMVIIYKVSLLSFLAGRLVIKIPDIGLVNVLAGRRIVPELVQGDATAGRIAEAAIEMLKNSGLRERMRVELREVRDKIGGPGASERAAREVMEFCRKHRNFSEQTA